MSPDCRGGSGGLQITQIQVTLSPNLVFKIDKTNLDVGTERQVNVTYHICLYFSADKTRWRSGDFTVTISPKEIRTFFIHFSSTNV